MFGISPAEFAVIAVILLVAVGPKQLPDVLRTLGRAYKKLNLFVRNVSQLIDDTLYDSERLADKAEKYLAAEPVKTDKTAEADSREKAAAVPDKKASGTEEEMPSRGLEDFNQNKTVSGRGSAKTEIREQADD